jgi:hypothetical protein
MTWAIVSFVMSLAIIARRDPRFFGWREDLSGLAARRGVTPRTGFPRMGEIVFEDEGDTAPVVTAGGQRPTLGTPKEGTIGTFRIFR